MTVKRCSKVSIPIVKRFLGENFGVVHALYHVTLCPGVQNNHSFEFFDPSMPIYYATFMRLRWRLRVVVIVVVIVNLYSALCDHTSNALNTKSVLRKEIRLKMAHESCKSQIAVLEINGQSVPQRWTSMREGSNTARRQCSAWNVELSAIRRAKILACRESGCRVAHSRQVVRCHPMETLEHLDADSETDAISDIQWHPSVF